MSFHDELNEIRWRAGLKEQTRHYPRIASASDIAEMVEELHHTPEDLEEGDLMERIYSHSKYHLTELPTLQITRGQWELHEDLVQTYMEAIRQGRQQPPIVIQELGGAMIDGTHRHEALVRLKVPKILAYVGRSADIVPDSENPYSAEYSDEEEWHPTDEY